VTATPRRLDDALGRWAFDPEPGDWDDVLRRSARPGWGDVLRRARTPLPALRLRRLSRRTVVGLGVLLAVAGPALGLVAAKQTIGRDATAPGPRLTARLTGPGGGSGSFTASFPGSLIAVRGPRGVRIAKPLRPGDRADRTPSMRVVWKLELEGVPEDVGSVRLRARGGSVVATLCDPCVRASGRARVPHGDLGAFFSGAADVEVTTSERTLTGPLRVVPRLHCGRRAKDGFVCAR
jgi:hypothetical protein